MLFMALICSYVVVIVLFLCCYCDVRMLLLCLCCVVRMLFLCCSCVAPMLLLCCSSFYHSRLSPPGKEHYIILFGYCCSLASRRFPVHMVRLRGSMLVSCCDCDVPMLFLCHVVVALVL